MLLNEVMTGFNVKKIIRLKNVIGKRTIEIGYLREMRGVDKSLAQRLEFKFHVKFNSFEMLKGIASYFLIDLKLKDFVEVLANFYFIRK